MVLEGRGDAPDIRLATPKGIGFLTRQNAQAAAAYALLQVLVREMGVKEIPTRKWWNRHLGSFLRV